MRNENQTCLVDISVWNRNTPTSGRAQVARRRDTPLFKLAGEEEEVLLS